MKALINQISKMTDKELLDAYQAMVKKTARIMLDLNLEPEIPNTEHVNKLDRLKKKYFYLEQEIEKRKLKQDLNISSIDIDSLRSAETEKLNVLLDKLGLEAVAKG